MEKNKRTNSWKRSIIKETASINWCDSSWCNGCCKEKHETFLCSLYGLAIICLCDNCWAIDFSIDPTSTLAGATVT